MSSRIFPTELTDDLRTVLGMPNFQCGPIAHAFRDAGRAEIKPRSEDEQAFVLHWLVGLVLEHGDAWRQEAAHIMQAVHAEAVANNEAKAKAKAQGRLQ